MAQGWYLYCLECDNGSVYTGIALDVEARFRQHVDGGGARYTRANPPRRILARVKFPDRSMASRAEYHVKRMTVARKWELCLQLQQTRPMHARHTLRRYLPEGAI